jgi:hypothetical protein
MVNIRVIQSTLPVSLKIPSKMTKLNPRAAVMDPLDKKLLRAWELSSGDFTDAVEAELNDLVPALVKAGYAKERSWGDDPAYFLWSFTERGVKRSNELEARESSDGG